MDIVRIGSRIGLLIFSFVILMELITPAQTDDHRQALFYEKDPKTGEYLDRPFELPEECDKMEEWVQHHIDTFDMRSIREYSYSGAFCNMHALLVKGSKTAKNDYVSRYDFNSLPLDLIPAHAIKCTTGIVSREWIDFCDKIQERSQEICVPNQCRYPLTYATFILGEGVSPDFSWSIRTDYTAIDQDTCRMRQGEFTGKLVIVNNRVTCRPRSPEEAEFDEIGGLYLDRVEFRDMNHDGYMDAVIKISETVHGSAPSREAIFVLTRFGDNATLQIMPKNQLAGFTPPS